MKAKKIIQTISRPIRPISNWCLQVWDGVSGKDYQQLKQLRHKLAMVRENEARLMQALTQTQAQCKHLEKALENSQHTLEQSQLASHNHQTALENSQKALIATKQQNDELWNDLDNWINDGESQIQRLQRELAHQKSALTTCEANLAAVNRSHAQPTSPISDSAPTLSLANWKIAFVGGHEATRRAVIQTLETDYELSCTPVEIPSHREASTSQKQLQQKLAECDLIISIIRYSNHSLTKSLKQLKDRGGLKGTILNTNSRGATGVVREILAFVDQHPDWLSDAAG